MFAVNFDTTISLGNVLSVILLAGTIFMAGVRMKNQINKIAWRVGMLWHWYAKEHHIKENGNGETK